MSSQTSNATESQTENTSSDNKIILFKGQSQYDVVRIFVDDLAAGFQELGYEAIVIDLLEPDFFQKISSIKGKARCFFSFNGMGIGLEVNGKPLFDFLNTPLVAWYVDHPFYVSRQLSYDMERSIVLISNENFYQYYLKRYRRPGTISQCLQISGRKYVESFVPYEQRNLDLVFFGSWLDPLAEQEKQLTVKNKKINELIWETIEEAKFERERELADIFDHHLIEMGLEPDELAEEVVQHLLSDIDLSPV